MHRYLKKPRDMKTRDYVTRVQELNSYITEFPAPANNNADSFDNDEIMDILEYGMPASWKSVMLA